MNIELMRLPPKLVEGSQLADKAKQQQQQKIVELFKSNFWNILNFC